MAAEAGAGTVQRLEMDRVACGPPIGGPLDVRGAPMSIMSHAMPTEIN